MATPLEPQDRPLYAGHECQNGCGRLADVVITTLADSGVEILCQPCHLVMMLAVAAAIPDPAGAEGVPETTSAG
jgi:hypothetical protein